MLWLPVTFLALFASAQGRAVNISNTWVLPEEGFPVFYRYFRDRISWYEADAVCQFHHANLVTVDTTAQYDAVRAYLKELDIASAVWVGLIRSNPDGDFTWTDYRGLSSEGYWSAAPDARAAPLCAAADPAADYRWEARACGGPSVASFICELPVPQWALGNVGCMVRALPALTALYLPESAAVQLTADCGLAGVKRVQCTGNVKREELLRDLSCSDENDPSSTLSLTSTSTIWPASDTTLTDQEMTTEDLPTEDNNIVTEFKETSDTETQITQTISPYNIDKMSEAKTSIKHNLNNDYIRLPLDKHVEPIHTNNILSNDILLHENPLENQNLQKIEIDNNYKHRLLHEEMTRLGNLDTIFTQPTDHFVPPLVMAKARISDDMTVLSLQEKHAQQIAEQRLHKHNKLVEHTNITPSETTILDTKVLPTDIPLTANKQKPVKQDQTPAQSVQNDSVKKNIKYSVPKKYVNKYNIPKEKIWRTVDYKTQKLEKIDVPSTKQIISATTKREDLTTKILNNTQKDSEEDSVIDLMVIIKEPGTENGQEIFYSNHSNKVHKFKPMINVTDENIKATEVKYLTTEKPYSSTTPATDESSQATSTVTLSHEIIKITVLNDKTSTESSTPLVFEVSTMIPVLNNSSGLMKETLSSALTSGYPASPIIINKNLTEFSSTANTLTTHALGSELVTAPAKEQLATSAPSTTHDITVENKDNIASSPKELVTKHEITTDAITISTSMPVNEITTEDGNKLIATNVFLSTKFPEITITEKTDMLNHTEHNDNDQDQQESEMIDDYQSPLLSAANEPLHRPSRSRRPQPLPNRMKKFNPFRMLG